MTLSDSFRYAIKDNANRVTLKPEGEDELNWDWLQNLLFSTWLTLVYHTELHQLFKLATQDCAMTEAVDCPQMTLQFVFANSTMIIVHINPGFVVSARRPEKNVRRDCYDILVLSNSTHKGNHVSSTRLMIFDLHKPSHRKFIALNLVLRKLIKIK